MLLIDVLFLEDEDGGECWTNVEEQDGFGIKEQSRTESVLTESEDKLDRFSSSGLSQCGG